MAVDSTPTGAERRRLRQDRRIVDPSRSRRVPIAVAVGTLMAFVVGWVAVRAFNSEPRRASAAVFSPTVPASAPARTPETLRTAATPAAPAPAPSPVRQPPSPTATTASVPPADASPDEAAASRAGTAPSPVARPTARVPSPNTAPEVVHPETETPVSTSEDRAERGSRVATLRRALQRRDAVSRRCEELRRQLDVGVISDTEEYQRTQALLDEALDELERLDAEVARLKEEITGG